MKRQCSGCTLCCKLLPVVEIKKLDGQRCWHQCAAGCRVYGDPARMPPSCRIWNCRWIVGELPRDLRRPDRAHYVVDVMPDYVEGVDHSTNSRTDIPVVQVWCDPDYPEAHRDPALRAWLDAEGLCALIRFSARDALFIAPPSVNHGAWYEHRGQSTNRTHTMREIIEHTGDLTRGNCTKCGARGFVLGPRGGESINIECAACKARFNVTAFAGQVIMAEEIPGEDEGGGRWPSSQ